MNYLYNVDTLHIYLYNSNTRLYIKLVHIYTPFIQYRYMFIHIYTIFIHEVAW